MAFVPTYCDSCSCSCLQAADEIRDGVAVCDDCGGMPRPVPGSNYALGDVALYKALALLLKDAGITPLNALRLLEGVATSGEATAGQVLKYVASVLPAFAVLEQMFVDDRAAARRTERMLATLLSGIATGRSQSGILSAESAVNASFKR